MGPQYAALICLFASALWPRVGATREHTFGLVVLARPEVNPALVARVEARVIALGDAAGLRVLDAAALGAALGGDVRQAMGECRGQFGCFAALAGRAGADALVVARAMASKVAPDGVLVQFLVIGREAQGIERKCGLEVATAEDVDVAVQASFLSLFGVGSPVSASAVRLPPPRRGPEASGAVWARFSAQLDAIERELISLDPGPAGAAANVAALNDLLTALQALLSQVEASIASADAGLAPAWLRAAPEAQTASDGPP